MSNGEYQDLARRMERIERLLERLVGGDSPAVTKAAEAQPVEPPDLSEMDRVRAVQAEGRFILETQGLAAYKAFWQQQGKKRKPRLKKAA